jgi:drug/metabolite transporter (DMT)-like permease
MVALPAWLIWNEVPGPWTWAGGAVIVGSAVWLTLHEARERRNRPE